MLVANNIKKGKVVPFQLDEKDENCSNGSGKVLDVFGYIVKIKTDSGDEPIFRVIKGDKLKKNAPFQYDERDKKCEKGSGEIISIAGSVVQIQPNSGSGSETLHRFIVGNRLQIKKQ